MQTKQPGSRPGVGIGTIVISDDSKILMGKRLSSGLYGFPGGHLERLESWEECGRRELHEETNIDVPEENFKFLVANNIIDPQTDFHYLDINLVCRYPRDQELINTEPEKCGGWEWWTLEEIESRRSELFYPIQILLDQKEQLFNMSRLIKLFE